MSLSKSEAEKLLARLFPAPKEYTEEQLRVFLRDDEYQWVPPGQWDSITWQYRKPDKPDVFDTVRDGQNKHSYDEVVTRLQVEANVENAVDVISHRVSETEGGFPVCKVGRIGNETVWSVANSGLLYRFTEGGTRHLLEGAVPEEIQLLAPFSSLINLNIDGNYLTGGGFVLAQYSFLQWAATLPSGAPVAKLDIPDHDMLQATIAIVNLVRSTQPRPKTKVSFRNMREGTPPPQQTPPTVDPVDSLQLDALSGKQRRPPKCHTCGKRGHSQYECTEVDTRSGSASNGKALDTNDGQRPPKRRRGETSTHPVSKSELNTDSKPSPILSSAISNVQHSQAHAKSSRPDRSARTSRDASTRGESDILNPGTQSPKQEDDQISRFKVRMLDLLVRQEHAVANAKEHHVTDGKNSAAPPHVNNIGLCSQQMRDALDLLDAGAHTMAGRIAQFKKEIRLLLTNQDKEVARAKRSINNADGVNLVALHFVKNAGLEGDDIRDALKTI